MKKYISVVQYKTAEVVKRIDVTGKTERQIDSIDSGLNVNLNHEEFYTVYEEEDYLP